MKEGGQAQTDFRMEEVHNLNDLKIKMGVDIRRSSDAVNAAFGYRWNEQKNHVLVCLYHTFFTASYESPQNGFRGILKEDTEPDLLTPYTGPENPICYVSSVTYGRAYYLLCESSYSADKMIEALFADFSDIPAPRLRERGVDEVLASMRVRTMRWGKEIDPVWRATSSFRQVKRAMESEAKFSKDDAGTPISFTVKHLYDDSPVRMSNTLKYNYQRTTFYPKFADNNVAIFAKRIEVEAHPHTNHHIADSAYVKVKEVWVTYTYKSGSLRRTYLYTNHPRPWSLLHTACPYVYRWHSEFLFNHAHSITLSARLAIRSETFRTGSDGSHTGSSEEEFDLVQTFTYSEKDGWQAEEVTDASTENRKFSVIGVRRNTDKLDMAIRLYYSFYIDGILQEAN